MALDLARSDIADTLRASPFLYVGVATRRGPHVTPELFVTVDNRLWCFTSARAAKVKAVSKRRRAGLLVRAGADAAILAGDATVIDLAHPTITLAAAPAALELPRVAAAFASRHALEITGAALDVVSGRLGFLPGRWVALCFEIDAAAVVRDGSVVHANGWGDVSPEATDTDDDATDTAVDPEALPERVRHLASGPTAALGLTGVWGPLVLPTAWDRTSSTATVPADVFDTLDPFDSGPAAVTFDEWIAPGPSGKRGVMLQGGSSATRRDGAVTLAIAVERAVVWDGNDATSITGIRDSTEPADHNDQDNHPTSGPHKHPSKEMRAG